MNHYLISLNFSYTKKLYQFKDPLSQYLEDNGDYNDQELIVINNNSWDSKDKLIRNKLSNYIISGGGAYYKTYAINIFHSLVKNIQGLRRQRYLAAHRSKKCIEGKPTAHIDGPK